MLSNLIGAFHYYIHVGQAKPLRQDLQQYSHLIDFDDYPSFCLFGGIGT